MSNSPIDQPFDLDLALTMVEDTSTLIKISDSPTSHRSDFPTVTDSGVCAVCMETFQSGAAGKQVPCGHVYHGVCITEWLSLHNSCPLCRFSVSGDGKLSFYPSNSS